MSEEPWRPEPREPNLPLIQITAPHFCAGLVAKDGRVIRAAPIIKYMRGWTGQQVADYCREKGWHWERIEI